MSVKKGCPTAASAWPHITSIFKVFRAKRLSSAVWDVEAFHALGGNNVPVLIGDLCTVFANLRFYAACFVKSDTCTMPQKLSVLVAELPNIDS